MDIDQSIICEAIFDEEGSLSISWIRKDTLETYNVLYRIDPGSNWIVEAQDLTDTIYTFGQQWEVPVEILIEKSLNGYATGYLFAGQKVFRPDSLERMLILIEDSLYQGISDLIDEYQEVLEKELIETDLEIIDNSVPVQEVKEIVLQANAVGNLNYILILGHVAVPYSGNNAIDGHNNHQGAWVADGFYGDINGSWTDISVDNTSASREANWNVPEDGKYDQSFFPSDVEIAVGRVDFSDLPKLEQDEIELTRRYLRRNIDYRLGEIQATKRAIVDNNFNLGEGFGQGAIKSLHAILEADSISYGKYDQCLSQDYLFTYGAGGGNYQGASGIINTNTLVEDSIQSIFTMIFGSYFGDWDVSNNLLRASLARGSTLINAWSGRPIWYFHHMAMGETIGYELLNTQNNSSYLSQFGKRMCHTSLLGDPSLKLYYEKPITDLEIDGNTIEWKEPESQDGADGYAVYYNQGGHWKVYGDAIHADTDFDLSLLPSEGLTKILVKPLTLISSNSGSYYNEGSGALIEVLLSNTDDVLPSSHVYPNPAQDFIILADSKYSTEVQIFDMTGRLVKKHSKGPRIDISSLNIGLYTLVQSNQRFLFLKE